jgi:aspartyl-tRNA synthetase
MERIGNADGWWVMEIKQLKIFLSVCEYMSFTKAAKALNYSQSTISDNIKKLEKFVADYGAKGLAWFKIKEDGVNSPIEKFLSTDEVNGVVEAMDAEVGDLLLFVADQKKVVYDALGALRVHIAEDLDVIDKSEYDLLWVTDFPVFEYDDEEKRFVAKHHPFTAPKFEDIELLETDPEKARANAYDIVLNGFEIGGGSIRINTLEMQQKMFKALGFTKEEADEKFGFLLEAFKYGAPPHGGIAYGLDRIAMILTDSEYIREGIAFPKTQNATSLLTDAPAIASKSQLEELGIQLMEQSD